VGQVCNLRCLRHGPLAQRLTHPLQLFVLFYVLLYVSQTLIALMNGLQRTGSGLLPQVAGAVATLAVNFQ